MSKTQMGMLAALCALVSGCADAAPVEETTSSVGATGGASTGGTSMDSATNGGSMAMSNTGGTDATGGQASGGQTMGGQPGGGDDGGAMIPTPSDCTNDPATPGNECVGAVTCTLGVESCSLTTQNCCVKDYDPDAASCNEGTACDGLASAACDGPEDCGGGQTCCISITPTGLSSADIKHRCVADTTQCTGGIFNSILCHTADDCEAGKDCLPIMNLPFWGSCK